MAEKFPFSIWNYNSINDFSPDEVNVWADCGLTVTMSPKVVYGKDDLSALIPMLDVAAKRDIKLIAYIVGLESENLSKLGEEEYKKRSIEVYETVKHPALYGFFIGDEPGTKEQYENSFKAIKMQKELFPHLRPYMNLHTNMDDTDPELLGGRTFREWIRELAAETGFKNFSYGHYDQMWDENGINSYYRNIKALTEAADEAGVDLWNTMLSSAHYMFRVPSEYDIMWQITTAAACGSRGINWFRFYDRSIGHNYHGSPIDEYGNKTELYYAMLRCQRRFNDHYGELIMSLSHKKTYLTHKPYGGYDLFGTGTHKAITGIRSEQQAVIGFFEDRDGNEYMCVVNGSQKDPAVFRIDFDRENYKLEEITFNGRVLSEYEHQNTEAHCDGQWLYPGQMNMFKISKK